MNCKQTQQLLDTYIDGDLSPVQLNDLHQHLNHCTACRHDLESAEKLLASLKDIPVPAAKPGFESRVLTFLQESTKPEKSHHNWFAAGFVSAIAASFALWIVISPVLINKNTPELINTVNLTVQQHKKIDLVFNLPNALADATLTLDLPDNVEIEGYPGQHQLSWKTSLTKGTNRLALPLIATQQKTGVLVASLTKNGKTKVFRIRLNTQKPASSGLIPGNNKFHKNNQTEAV